MDSRTFYRDEQDFGTAAVEALEKHCKNMNDVYGACAADDYSINALSGEGKLTELLEFVAG